MTVESQIGLIDRLHGGVRQALGQWDATSPEQLMLCLKTLEQTAEATHGSWFPDNAPSAGQYIRMRAGLLGTRAQIAQLQHLIDSSAACLRRMSPSGDVEYAPTGRSRRIVKSLPGEGVRG